MALAATRMTSMLIAVVVVVASFHVAGAISADKSLKTLCDQLGTENFDIVYDIYGVSLRHKKSIRDESTATLDEMEGFCVDMFRKFIRRCPIKYKLKKNFDGYWGNNVNGSWNGMVGQLVRGEASMALTYYYIQPHLSPAVDFSRAFMSSGIAIVMRDMQADNRSSLRQFLFRSFTLDGWMLLLGMTLLGLFVVMLLVYLTPPTKRYAHFDAKDTMQYHMHQLTPEEYKYKIFWFFIYSMLGFDDVNRSLYNNPLRMMGFFWVFYFWIVFTIFSAQITSDMTLGSVSRQVETFSDLLASPGLKYFFDGGDTGLLRNLRLHRSKTAQDLLRKYESFGEEYHKSTRPSDVYLSAEDIQKYTCPGYNALLSEGIDYSVVMTKNMMRQCQIYSVTDYTIKVDPAFVFRQNCRKTAKLKRAFNIFISIIIRDGTLDRIMRKWGIPYLGERKAMAKEDSAESDDDDDDDEKEEESESGKKEGLTWDHLFQSAIVAILGLVGAILVSAASNLRSRGFFDGVVKRIEAWRVDVKEEEKRRISVRRGEEFAKLLTKVSTNEPNKEDDDLNIRAQSDNDDKDAKNNLITRGMADRDKVEPNLNRSSSDVSNRKRKLGNGVSPMIPYDLSADTLSDIPERKRSTEFPFSLNIKPFDWQGSRRSQGVSQSAIELSRPTSKDLEGDSFFDNFGPQVNHQEPDAPKVKKSLEAKKTPDERRVLKMFDRKRNKRLQRESVSSIDLSNDVTKSSDGNLSNEDLLCNHVRFLPETGEVDYNANVRLKKSASELRLVKQIERKRNKRLRRERESQDDFETLLSLSPNHSAKPRDFHPPSFPSGSLLGFLPNSSMDCLKLKRSSQDLRVVKHFARIRNKRLEKERLSQSVDDLESVHKHLIQPAILIDSASSESRLLGEDPIDIDADSDLDSTDESDLSASDNIADSPIAVLAILSTSTHALTPIPEEINAANEDRRSPSNSSCPSASDTSSEHSSTPSLRLDKLKAPLQRASSVIGPLGPVDPGQLDSTWSLKDVEVRDSFAPCDPKAMKLGRRLTKKPRLKLL